MTADRQSEFAIVSPVTQFLGAADVDRTLVFYRDILGFDVARSETDPKALEVRSGPARIHFGPHEYGPDGREDPKPSPAVVFFETNNVERLHAAVRTRGGSPSPLQPVNGIKMRVFEIRDPDGHVLWFGQSFAEPDHPPPPGLLEKMMPGLPLSDVQSGVDYYRNALGFTVNYERVHGGDRSCRRRHQGSPIRTDGRALPSIFSVLPQQVGLKLEPQRGPSDILVIDQAERPTED